MSREALAVIRQSARWFETAADAFGPLLDSIGDGSLLLIGEASHDEFEDQAVNPVTLLEPIDGSSVWVVQRCQQPRLLLEPRAPVWIRGEHGGQDLDRDVAVEFDITRTVDVEVMTGKTEPRQGSVLD
jgi:hypothetical protein